MRIRRAAYVVAITFLTLHVAFFVPTLALAQPNPNAPSQGPVPTGTPLIRTVGEGNQYYLGQANELLIRVNVWGRVQRPGQYYVPATTDLITLISLAGGPAERSRLTDVRVVRGSKGSDNDVMIVNLRKYLKTGDKRLIPDLKPEDTVIVSGTVWQLVADVVGVLGGLGLIATAYYNFTLRR